MAVKQTWVLNALTLALAIAWLVTFTARQFRPIDGTQAMDAAMLLVVGFWFSKSAISGTKDKKDDDGAS